MKMGTSEFCLQKRSASCAMIGPEPDIMLFGASGLCSRVKQPQTTTVFCGEILDFASTKNFADLLDLFKGPNYEFIRQQVSKDVKVNYQKKFRRSMASLVEFLRQA